MADFEFLQVIREFDSNAASATMREYIVRSPGFFTPYRSVGDFVSTAAAPVVVPTCFAVLTGLLGLASGLSAAVCVTSFAAAGIAAAAGNHDARDGALIVGVMTGLLAVAAPLLAAVAALAVVASFLAATVRLVNRTGATVVSAIGSGVCALTQCCRSEEDNHEIEMVTYSPG